MPNRRVRVVTASPSTPQSSALVISSDPRVVRRPALRSARRGRRERGVTASTLVSRAASRGRADRRGRVRLQQEAEERAELLAFVAHELRTPLAAVIGYTEVLLDLDAGDLNEQQVRMLERVSTSGERLCDLIEGLLDAVGDERDQHNGLVDVASAIEQTTGAQSDAGALRSSA